MMQSNGTKQGYVKALWDEGKKKKREKYYLVPRMWVSRSEKSLHYPAKGINVRAAITRQMVPNHKTWMKFVLKHATTTVETYEAAKQLMTKGSTGTDASDDDHACGSTPVISTPTKPVGHVIARSDLQGVGSSPETPLHRRKTAVGKPTAESLTEDIDEKRFQRIMLKFAIERKAADDRIMEEMKSMNVRLSNIEESLKTTHKTAKSAKLETRMPINDWRSYHKLEEELKNPAKHNCMVEEFTIIGSNNVREFLRNALSMVIKRPEFCQYFNITGETRKTGPKTNILQTNIFKILWESVHTLYPEVTMKIVRTYLSDILKRSSGCAGGTKYTYVKVDQTRKRKRDAEDSADAEGQDYEWVAYELKGEESEKDDGEKESEKDDGEKESEKDDGEKEGGWSR